MKGAKEIPPDRDARKAGDDDKVTLGQWDKEPKPVRRTFPGPRGAEVPLRVAVGRKAYADALGHARESLDAEICGVLAGQVCEDDEGLFVHVEAAIRGGAARESNARVTFTQDTWNFVHETLERDYPKLRIVGWYHSHPGFGVEFSEMDVFIQKNFFPSPTQIALVTDPLGLDTAICRNAEQGIEYFERFWVDGREHALRVPGPARGGNGGPAVAGPAALEGDVRSIELRLGQLIQAVDEQRNLFHHFLIALLVIALTSVAGWVGWNIWSAYTSRFQPPQLSGYIPVPIRIGDKTIMIGVGVVQWEVPPELNAIELAKQELAGEKNSSPTPAPPAGSAGPASPAATVSLAPAKKP